MPEATQIVFKHAEVVELLIKKQNIHQGVWGLFIKFGMNATNAGPTEAEIMPAVIIGVLEIGLHKFEKESNIALDAAKVNPRVRELAEK